MAAIANVVNADWTTDPILDNQVIGDLTAYSIREEATPLAPGDSNGATSDVTVTGVSKPRARLAMTKGLSLVVPHAGTALAHITEISQTKKDGLVTLVADSLLNRLNADGRVPPDLNIDKYFTLMCAAVGIPESQVGIELPVMNLPSTALPGFVGNLWDAAKQLCAAYGLEIYSTGDMVGIALPGRVHMEVTEPDTTTVGINRTERAASVSIVNYNAVYSSSAVLFKATEVYSVAAGEVQEIRVTAKGTPETVDQPVIRSGMTLSDSYATGQYVVTGSDGYIVSPAFWDGNGGKVEVSLSEDAADELVIKITGPNVPSRSPYRISEGQADRPALWIKGRGTILNPETLTIWTGDPTAPQELVEIDNKFIASRTQAYDRGVRAAQRFSGPQITVTMNGTPDLVLTYADGGTITSWFGSIAGAMVDYGNNCYRVLSADYHPTGIDLVLQQYVPISEFNAIWAGKTVNDINAVMAGQTLNQWSINPLATSA